MSHGPLALREGIARDGLGVWLERLVAAGFDYRLDIKQGKAEWSCALSGRGGAWTGYGPLIEDAILAALDAAAADLDPQAQIALPAPRHALS